MPEDKEFKEYLERRAEELGLPTDPEAYQDGGLAVATTAGNVQEADFLAAMLQGEGIPAWVEGGSTSTWYWYMQYALHPGGIRILVPMGRLADAQALLAQHGERREVAEKSAEPEPQQAAPDVPEEPEDPAYPLYRRARGLAYLLLIGPLYPVIFVLVLALLVSIHRQKKRTGASRHLVKARRIAIITLIYLSLCGAVVATALLGSVFRVPLDSFDAKDHKVIEFTVPAHPPKTPQPPRWPLVPR